MEKLVLKLLDFNRDFVLYKEKYLVQLLDGMSFMSLWKTVIEQTFSPFIIEVITLCNVLVAIGASLSVALES